MSCAASWKILTGDVLDTLRTMPDESVNCCVTSPPYYALRDYGVPGQLGLEPTPAEYVAKMVAVFAEVRRVLRDDGTLWLNLGDSYAGNASSGGQDTKTAKRGGFADGSGPDSVKISCTKPGKSKDLLGIPWRVAFALQSDGWYLRQDIIWAKPNPMPESVRDRCTKAHEYLFLLSKSARYWWDAGAMKERAVQAAHVRRRASNFKGVGSLGEFGKHCNGSPEIVCDGTRNRRSVWTVSTRPYKGAHFATFPPKLIEPCILAGCPPQGKRCDCDEVIATPTGEGEIDDPSLITGRAGMNRPRRDTEGTRPITRREQRHEAEIMKRSTHRAEMAEACGPAFAHYIRTDRSGGRPLPEHHRAAFRARGWISEAPPCIHPVEPAGTVLDPFAGSGTTLAVARKHRRNGIGIELNPAYVTLAEQRINSHEYDPEIFEG